MLTPEQELEFCRLRREIIGLNYQTLNSEQRRAVLATAVSYTHLRAHET